MRTNQEIKNLVEAHILLHEEIMNRGNIEDLETINDHLGIVIKQLDFWQKQKNASRYIYDLRSYANWILKNFN